nr:MAG TPA: hypothetical protein [Caudoviricetes sp.]
MAIPHCRFHRSLCDNFRGSNIREVRGLTIVHATLPR